MLALHIYAKAVFTKNFHVHPCHLLSTACLDYIEML